MKNAQLLNGKLFFAYLLCVALCKCATAQVDPHFSQYYVYPMALNPALTGTIDGDYRVSAIWRNLYANTLTARGVSGEIVTDKNTNFGVSLLNQASDDRSYNFTNANITMSYTGIRLDEDGYKYLALALQCGVLNRRFDVSKLQFGSQWSAGLGYDPSNNSGQTFNKTSVTAFDAGVGLAYLDATPEQTLNTYIGFSAFHLNRPATTFLSPSGASNALPIRYCIHGGIRTRVSDLLTLVPNVLYMKQGQSEEKMAGLYAQRYVSENVDIMLGCNWRVKDAIVPFAGLYYKGLVVGLSYDVNASSLSASTNRANSIELSLSFIGNLKRELKTRPFNCQWF